jgi:hypothetical protein
LDTKKINPESRKDAKAQNFLKKKIPLRALRLGVRSAREIEIRATHEIMTTRTTQLALFIDQLVPAPGTIPPVLAADVLGR